eukprot:CAMPEP_0197826198 /NCGR_PEP_ID=MMETSP1437-20131217/3183_1 /TAXON_ID=49252 ORGANISM="Eucampia antarctica, Strain CCMP1452" /NCGR_SAMPLE_ID=MMETSP1437 /ASSEMBLY_ACC=CAM_ASM_001096 /LENGTH=147 /DNA_ID=CAMNT_0043426529 /DNA_START=1 /DNA_END=441 /DNA_ORIENTATION=-
MSPMETNEGPSQSENASQKHELFIEALERFGVGNEGDEWEKMASYLQSSVWEVKIYASTYMHQLCELDTMDEGSSTLKTLEDDLITTRQPQQPTLIPPDNITTVGGYHSALDDDADWTCDECILFDNLLALYPPFRHDVSKTTSSKW